MLSVSDVFLASSMRGSEDMVSLLLNRTIYSSRPYILVMSRRSHMGLEYRFYSDSELLLPLTSQKENGKVPVWGQIPSRGARLAKLDDF